MAQPKKYVLLAPLAKDLRKTATLDEIGWALGMSPTRVFEMLKKADRDAAMPEWTRGLDIQIANALIAAGFTSKNQVREVIDNDESIPRVKAVRLEIIRQWLDC